MNTLRNWGCGVEILVGDDKLRFYFENKIIGKETTRVIYCERIKVKAINGTKLIISNCTSTILKEFEFGLNYFYSEANPLFGEIFADTPQKDIIIYKSSKPQEGYVFYKKLLRSKIDLPIIIVCNKPYLNIENKIKHDRDRKAFSKDVLEALVKLVFRNFRNFELKAFFHFLKNWWVEGDKFLSLIS